MNPRDRPIVVGAKLLCIGMMLYVSGYLVSSLRGTGKMSIGGTQVFAWHHRGYPVDPFFYLPLARAEQWARGEKTQVCLYGPGAPGFQKKYRIGPPDPR